MPLNESKGDMYTFVTHTWNTIKGKCYHDCSYCYMKQYGEQKPIRFDKKEFKTDLGKDKFIFVGSSCDMWAEDVPDGWIMQTLGYVWGFKNKYLFQSKNPGRMVDIYEQDPVYIPATSTLGTTIETNRAYPEMGKAPKPSQRAESMKRLSHDFHTFVTIEPIMDFDVDYLYHLIDISDPGWVNIGADSKGHGLPEPSADKINELIGRLKNGGIEVKLKSNLKRLGV